MLLRLLSNKSSYLELFIFNSITDKIVIHNKTALADYVQLQKDLIANNIGKDLLVLVFEEYFQAELE